MKVKYTKTYEWLAHWTDVLIETRKRNSKFYDPKYDPFYVLDNVGLYTFMPFKVAWREQNKRMLSCVISKKDKGLLSGKMIIPDSKVIFCAVDNEDEAHFLCAILNSKVVTEVIDAYAIETQRGTDIFHNIAIPDFDMTSMLHKSLADLSKAAHNAFLAGTDIQKIQKRIDQQTELLFNKLSNDSLHEP